MINSLEEFTAYIKKISTQKHGEEEIVDTYWLQSIVPIHIVTEKAAIEYLFNHQDLLDKASQKG